MRAVVFVLVGAAVMGCGGGGGTTPIPAAAPWEKFRHDAGNSGHGGGSIVVKPGSLFAAAVTQALRPIGIRWATCIDDATCVNTSPVSASPAIGTDGTVFVGSEGGTLAALDPTPGLPKWTMKACSPCSAPTPTGAGPTCAQTTTTLGPLLSSPAVYTDEKHTSIFVGSMSHSLTLPPPSDTVSGAVYVFEFDEGDDSPQCTACFRPACLPTDPTHPDTAVTDADFVSSPAFTIDAGTAKVAGVFIGATVTHADGSSDGKLYAINADGSLKWQFPRTRDAAIGPISSSPAIGLGNAIFFATDDGELFALTPQGELKWRTTLPSGADASLAPSVVATASTVIGSSASGDILALNPDATFHWLGPTPGDPTDGFANSVAVGAPAETPTPTPSKTPTGTIGPTLTPTPVPTSLTPTLTPLPVVPLIAVVAVRNSGTIVLLDAATGAPLQVSGMLPAIAGPVVSSPALSGDGYIVVGDHDGKLHAISTASGEEPTPWPFVLVPTPAAGGPTPVAQPIRSSPAIGSDGTVYVGSDDGRLYAVGAISTTE